MPWASTGWTNNRNVTQMLEFLMMRGEVAIAGRVGRERLWDLAERVYPADVVVPSEDDAHRIKNERRLASLGIARRKSTTMPLEPVDVGEAGEPAVVEGTKGEWRVDPPRSARTSRGVRRCCRRSTGSCTTVSAPRSCSTSSTPSRCTSPLPSAAGATLRSRSSTTTGWSGK